MIWDDATLTKHYVEFMTIYMRTISEEISDRNVEITLPDNCVAYRFYDTEDDCTDGVPFFSGPINISPWHYKGRLLSNEELEQYRKDPVHRLNTTHERCSRGVLTDYGLVFCLEHNDKVF